jgi:hypothetical protein
MQRVIKCDGVLQRPIIDGLLPLVLQYADDILIILHADEGAAVRLESILYDFAAATGLVINFSKSTLVPMSTDDVRVSSIHMCIGMGRFCTD